MRIARGISVTNTSRPISTAIVYDADAVAFFTAASITDNTQKSAVNTLVLSLKSANIWTKMKALYPVVGGVASSHAVNLKTPGTYNLSFATGWTHSSTGMTPNGATYADTFLVPSTALSLNNTHLSFYSRTNIAANTHQMGSSQLTSEAQYLTLITRYVANTAYYAINVSQTNIGSTLVSNSDSRGFFIGSRTASNVVAGFRNSTKQLTGTVTSTTIPNTKVFLGAINAFGSAGAYSTNECAFASIGDGLTDTDATNFYNAIQTMQTTLGRQV